MVFDPHHHSLYLHFKGEGHPFVRPLDLTYSPPVWIAGVNALLRIPGCISLPHLLSGEMGKAPRGGALSLKGPFHRDSETNDLPNAPSPRSRASASRRISTIQLSHTPARLAIEGSGQGVWHILGGRGRLRGAFSRGCLGSGTTSAHERSAPKGIYAIKPDHRRPRLSACPSK